MQIVTNSCLFFQPYAITFFIYPDMTNMFRIKEKKQVYLAPQVIKAWDALQAVLIVSWKQDFKLSSATHTLQS